MPITETTKQIGVFPVYQNGELIAIVSRDDKSGKWLVYKVEESSGEDIIKLMVKE